MEMFSLHPLLFHNVNDIIRFTLDRFDICIPQINLEALTPVAGSEIQCL